MKRLTYDEVLGALERALVFGIHPSLDGIRELTEALGRPQDAFDAIQVTGTNGKTSTVRLTEALLRAEGVRTGLYTSPHLERYPERIEVLGAVATDEEFATAVSAALDAAERTRPGLLGTPEGHTEFELLTAAALWWFAQQGVEVAVLEVGMGGRWDATTVVDPIVAVITGVGLDHAAILGDSLEQIAAEKAGIIKPGCRVVLGPGTEGLEQPFVLRAAADEASVSLVREGGARTTSVREPTVRYRLRARPGSPLGATLLDVSGLLGEYPSLAVGAPSFQAANVATAIASAEAALGRELSVAHARAALCDVTFPGRFEVLHAAPPLVIDGAHNPQSARALAGAVAEAWPDSAHRPVVLLGVLSDKDADGIVSALAKVAAGFVATRSSSPRAIPAAELGTAIERATGVPPAGVFDELPDALSRARELGPDGVLATGSITIAGDARRLIGVKRRPPLRHLC